MPSRERSDGVDADERTVRTSVADDGMSSGSSEMPINVSYISSMLSRKRRRREACICLAFSRRKAAPRCEALHLRIVDKDTVYGKRSGVVARAKVAAEVGATGTFPLVSGEQGKQAPCRLASPC